MSKMSSRAKTKCVLGDQENVSHRRGEVDHVARLAESQREWLINAKCATSDTDDSYRYDRSRRKARLPVERNHNAHKRKLGVALKRFPKKVSKCSSSSSFDDTDEDIMVIDRSRINNVKAKALLTVASESSRFEKKDEKSDKCSRKLQHTGNVPHSAKQKAKNVPSYSEDDMSLRKKEKHMISIGRSSFGRNDVIAFLGDSIQFVLVEVEEASLLGEHVLTGVSATESLCFRIPLRQRDGMRRFEFCPSCVGSITATCSINRNIKCNITINKNNNNSTENSVNKVDDTYETVKLVSIIENTDKTEMIIPDVTKENSTENGNQDVKTSIINNDIIDYNGIYNNRENENTKIDGNPLLWKTTDSFLGIGKSVVKMSSSNTRKKPKSRVTNNGCTNDNINGSNNNNNNDDENNNSNSSNNNNSNNNNNDYNNSSQYHSPHLSRNNSPFRGYSSSSLSTIMLLEKEKNKERREKKDERNRQNKENNVNNENNEFSKDTGKGGKSNQNDRDKDSKDNKSNKEVYDSSQCSTSMSGSRNNSYSVNSMCCSRSSTYDSDDVISLSELNGTNGNNNGNNGKNMLISDKYLRSRSSSVSPMSVRRTQPYVQKENTWQKKIFLSDEKVKIECKETSIVNKIDLTGVSNIENNENNKNSEGKEIVGSDNIANIGYDVCVQNQADLSENGNNVISIEEGGESKIKNEVVDKIMPTNNTHANNTNNNSKSSIVPNIPGASILNPNPLLSPPRLHGSFIPPNIIPINMTPKNVLTDNNITEKVTAENFTAGNVVTEKICVKTDVLDNTLLDKILAENASANPNRVGIVSTGMETVVTGVVSTVRSPMRKNKNERIFQYDQKDVKLSVALAPCAYTTVTTTTSSMTTVASIPSSSPSSISRFPSSFSFLLPSPLCPSPPSKLLPLLPLYPHSNIPLQTHSSHSSSHPPTPPHTPHTHTHLFTRTSPRTPLHPTGLHGSFGVTTSSSNNAREVTDTIRRNAEARRLSGVKPGGVEVIGGIGSIGGAGMISTGVSADVSTGVTTFVSNGVSTGVSTGASTDVSTFVRTSMGTSNGSDSRGVGIKELSKMELWRRSILSGGSNINNMEDDDDYIYPIVDKPYTGYAEGYHDERSIDYTRRNGYKIVEKEEMDGKGEKDEDFDQDNNENNDVTEVDDRSGKQKRNQKKNLKKKLKKNKNDDITGADNQDDGCKDDSKDDVHENGTENVSCSNENEEKNKVEKYSKDHIIKVDMTSEYVKNDVIVERMNAAKMRKNQKNAEKTEKTLEKIVGILKTIYSPYTDTIVEIGNKNVIDNADNDESDEKKRRKSLSRVDYLLSPTSNRQFLESSGGWEDVSESESEDTKNTDETDNAENTEVGGGEVIGETEEVIKVEEVTKDAAPTEPMIAESVITESVEPESVMDKKEEKALKKKNKKIKDKMEKESFLPTPPISSSSSLPFPCTTPSSTHTSILPSTHPSTDLTTDPTAAVLLEDPPSLPQTAAPLSPPSIPLSSTSSSSFSSSSFESLEEHSSPTPLIPLKDHSLPLPLPKRNLADELRSQLGIGSNNGNIGNNGHFNPFTPRKDIDNDNNQTNQNKINGNKGVNGNKAKQEQYYSEIESFLSQRWDLMEEKMMADNGDLLRNGKAVKIIVIGGSLGKKKAVVDNNGTEGDREHTDINNGNNNGKSSGHVDNSNKNKINTNNNNNNITNKASSNTTNSTNNANNNGSINKNTKPVPKPKSPPKPSSKPSPNPSSTPTFNPLKPTSTPSGPPSKPLSKPPKPSTEPRLILNKPRATKTEAL